MPSDKNIFFKRILKRINKNSKTIELTGKEKTVKKES